MTQNLIDENLPNNTFYVAEQNYRNDPNGEKNLVVLLGLADKEIDERITAWNEWMQQKPQSDLIIKTLEYFRKEQNDNITTYSFRKGDEYKGNAETDFLFTNNSIHFQLTTLENEQVDLRNIEFKGDVSFENCSFGNDVRLDRARFNGDASFENVIFSQYVSFSNATFNQKILFNNIKFNGDVSFEASQILTGCSFKNIHFYEYVSFKYSIFQFDLSFDGIIFENDVSFYEASLGGVSFSDIQAYGDVSFETTNFKRKSSFKSIRFKKEVSFLSTKFDHIISFSEICFSKVTNFTNSKFNGWSFFNQVNFQDNAIFSNSEFKYINFNQVNFYKDGSFKNIFFQEDTLFNTIQFLHSNTTFEGSQFLGKVDMFGVTSNCVIDLRNTKIEYGVDFDKSTIGNQNPDENTSTAFRRLKKLAEDSCDHTSALDFFAKEIRSSYRYGLRGKNLTRWGYKLYDFFSNFGRSFWRPLGYLGITWFLFANIYFSLIDSAVRYKDFFSYYIKALFVSLSYALPLYGSATEGGKQALKQLFGEQVPLEIYAFGTFQMILSGVFIFLMVLALRNMFRV